MTKDEMLKQLGMDDGLGKVSGKASPQPVTAPTKPVGSPTVLALDKWDVARGGDLLKRSPELQRLKLENGDDTVADLHAVAFKPYPELTENPVDKVRSAFVQGLLDSGETQALRVSTVLNSIAADIAAVEFSKAYSAFLAELQKKQEETPDEDPSDDDSEGDDESAEGGEGEEGENDATSEAAASAARAAAKAASKEVEAMEDAVAAFGGYGEGSATTPPDQKKIAELYRKIRNNAQLRKITELAGRFRRVAQSKQKRKNRHGTDETTGITTGGKINRLLTRELARLTDPDLELDVLRRIVDRQAMIKEVKGKEAVGKGPIIVCVDESSSMSGSPIETAKAFALAMAWVARHQRRWCALVGYTGYHWSRADKYRHPVHGSGIRTLTLPIGKRDDETLLDWLTEFMGYGSDIDIPVREMPEIYKSLNAPAGVTDVIFITDAICNPPKAVINQFNAWKKESRAKLITLVVGCRDDGVSIMNAFSDEVYYAGTMLNENSDVVGRCLSI